MDRPDTLMLTNSHDVTSDIMIQCLGLERVFRWNMDLWSDYRLEWDSTGFMLEDPVGRKVRHSDLEAVYWRKVTVPEDDLGSGSKASWLAAQRRYLLRELVALLWRPDIAWLVEPYAEQRIGKLAQMRAAAEYFKVPPWRISLRGDLLCGSGRWLAKALVMEPTSEGKFLYATEVNPARLDPGETWFLQERVDAVSDVTVVYVDGRCFAYECAREVGVDDWRQTMTPSAPWVAVDFRDSVDRASRLMHRLLLRFGRLDFVRDQQGHLWFLEVNPNGQFAWLDTDGSSGLLDAIADAVRQNINSDWRTVRT